MMKQSYVLWLDHIEKKHISLIGDKAARLSKLMDFGVTVPEGFVVDTHAFQDSLKSSSVHVKISQLLESVDPHDPLNIEQVSHKIQSLVSRMALPKKVSLEVFSAYEKLGTQAVVVLRGSAHDQGNGLFKQEPILGVSGDAHVLDCMRKIWAGYFTQHIVASLIGGMLELESISISVVIEKMIDSDTSGITFTSSPDGSMPGKLYVYAIWGVRDEYISKQPYPDLYEVNTATWELGNKEVVDQRTMLQRVDEHIKQVDIIKEKQDIQKVSDANIVKIARVSKMIEDKLFYAQKIEWAIKDGQLYILDSTPLNTSQKLAHPNEYKTPSLLSNLKTIGAGEKIHTGKATGPCRWIRSDADVSKIRSQDIVILKAEQIDKIPFSKVAGLIITDGTSHQKSTLRLKEFGIPSILLKKFSSTPKNEQVISIDAQAGDVYSGSFPAKKITSSIKKAEEVVKIATKIFVNISSPEVISGINKKAVDGVGIIRSEFIFKNDAEDDAKKTLNKLITHLNLICQEMTQKPVYYRFSDDAMDNNPLGLRGVRKHLVVKKQFKIEAKAFHRVKQNYQQKNLHILLPFVRNVKDVKEIKQVLAEAHISRSNHTQFWIMAETPGSILDLEEIIKLGIDGIMIGFWDLTMLTLGIDRREADLSSMYQGIQSSVLSLITQAIQVGKKNNIPVVIAGGMMDIHPDIVDIVVKAGVYGFSVEADAADTLRNYIHLAERRLIGLKI